VIGNGVLSNVLSKNYKTANFSERVRVMSPMSVTSIFCTPAEILNKTESWQDYEGN